MQYQHTFPYDRQVPQVPRMAGGGEEELEEGKLTIRYDWTDTDELYRRFNCPALACTCHGGPKPFTLCRVY
jgi:hypothetical protein